MFISMFPCICLIILLNVKHRNVQLSIRCDGLICFLSQIIWNIHHMFWLLLFFCDYLHLYLHVTEQKQDFYDIKYLKCFIFNDANSRQIILIKICIFYLHKLRSSWAKNHYLRLINLVSAVSHYQCDETFLYTVYGWDWVTVIYILWCFSSSGATFQILLLLTPRLQPAVPSCVQTGSPFRRVITSLVRQNLEGFQLKGAW